MTSISESNTKQTPKHIAIIMDGNGRWAKQRNLDRTLGHQEGAKSVHKIAVEAAKMGTEYLTLYTFSSENWSRPDDEVNALMGLLLSSLDDDLFIENNIRFKVIGEESKLPSEVQERLNECKTTTQDNTGMTLVLALSYSSYWEMTEATKQIASLVKDGKLAISDITPEIISQSLATSFMPDPDLLIRTGGEFRLSNYLLWQCAYTEFYFCDTYWPDFNEEEFHKAIDDFLARERRFGKTSEQINK